MKFIVNHNFFEMLYEYSNLFKGADDELNQIRNICFIVNQIMIFISIVKLLPDFGVYRIKMI
jgi:hypothetical protein